jgi:hypothetical protein
MHGRDRGAALGGDLVVGQAAEVVELDDLREARLHLLQTLNGIVEGDDVETGHPRNGVLLERLVLRNPSFLPPARFSMVDQHPAHEPGGEGKKMSAILQRHVPLYQPQEGFVHHRGRLQGVIAPLRSHVVTRQPAKLLIDEGRQTLQGLGVAVTPVGQELREIRGHLHRRSLIATGTSVSRTPGSAHARHKLSRCNMRGFPCECRFT